MAACYVAAGRIVGGPQDPGDWAEWVGLTEQLRSLATTLFIGVTSGRSELPPGFAAPDPKARPMDPIPQIPGPFPPESGDPGPDDDGIPF